MGKCPLCNHNHPIKYCKTFRWMLNEERRETVVRLNYCLNCLCDRHLRKDCPSKKRCDVCGAAHNTMIHQRIYDSRSESITMMDVKEVEEEANSTDSEYEYLEGAVGGINLNAKDDSTLEPTRPQRSKLYESKSYRCFKTCPLFAVETC
ncbi:uncharacterized protein [Musca autumnalis]|uniref:uncharacterized protein n=1 Tax=Musca autumnalis TaxID=221902 RepID=UPI003CF283F9